MWAEAQISRRVIALSVLSPPPMFAVVHAIQTGLPSSGLLKLESEGREPCKACFSPSSRPFCKAPREGRLVSAASQKVPDRVPGDTECYHCLDSLKKERKAYGKKGGRRDMMESTQMCPEVSQFPSNKITLKLLKNVLLRFKFAFKLNHWNLMKWPNQIHYDTAVQSRVILV